MCVCVGVCGWVGGGKRAALVCVGKEQGDNASSLCPKMRQPHKLVASRTFTDSH